MADENEKDKDAAVNETPSRQKESSKLKLTDQYWMDEMEEGGGRS